MERILGEVRRPSRFLMSDLKWKLAEPNDGLIVEAEETGVWVRRLSGEITDPHQLRSHPAKTRLGRLLPTVVLQLLDIGVASLEHGGMRISHQEFARLEQFHRDRCIRWHRSVGTIHC